MSVKKIASRSMQPLIKRKEMSEITIDSASTLRLG